MEHAIGIVTCAALHNLRIKIKPWVYKNLFT